jgi:hypothetical protein
LNHCGRKNMLLSIGRVNVVVWFFLMGLGLKLAVGGKTIAAEAQEVRMNTKTARSVRLIFEYDGDQIRLIKQQEVDMAPPPGDAKSFLAQESGFWLEVRNVGMQVLHRQIMRDPIATHPEVFSDGGGKTIARSNEPSRKGAFTVVVPESPDNDHLAFVRANPAARSVAEKKLLSAAPTGEIARFSIKKDR